MDSSLQRYRQEICICINVLVWNSKKITSLEINIRQILLPFNVCLSSRNLANAEASQNEVPNQPAAGRRVSTINGCERAMIIKAPSHTFERQLSSETTSKCSSRSLFCLLLRPQVWHGHL